MITDPELYRPLFQPWEGAGFAPYYAIAAPASIVSRDRCYVLERLLRQTLPVDGNVFEAGVYKGGTAAMLAFILAEAKSDKTLFLFDSFAGMPPTDAQRDWHKAGDFADTSLETVEHNLRDYADRVEIRKGFIPDTFAGLGDEEISFCHVDVDIYTSIMDTLEFVWPRLSVGGVIVFDDYGFPTCPGAREAVDLFFQGKRAVPLCLHTGQAIVFKSTHQL